MNSKVDKGSPCLTPPLTGNKSVVKPLFKAQLDKLEQKVLIHCKKYGPKLNFAKTLKRKERFSESNAFSESIARRIL